MAGAIAPITLAGAVAQQNAEILAAVVLSQLVRPGAPIVHGTFTANVYMRSGAIAFGSPDLAKATLVVASLPGAMAFRSSRRSPTEPRHSTPRPATRLRARSDRRHVGRRHRRPRLRLDGVGLTVSRRR